MKIVVFGAGALGSLVGGLLSRAHDVTLIARREHAEAIRANGLAVSGNAEFSVRLRAQDRLTPDLAAGLVLLTVKSFDTEAALAQLAPLMGAGTKLVSVQNGLGNWELASTAFPRNLVLASSVLIGAAMEGPGRVSWNGPGEIVIGGSANDEVHAREVAEAFRLAGFQARTVPDIRPALWRKAMVNAAINPLSAIHRVPNGRLLDDPQLRAELFAAAMEAAAVARRVGVEIADEEALATIERVARQTAGNRSSMLQDVERGRRTEIDAINGKIIEAAKRQGVPCPVNESLYRAVKRLEERTATA